jgi:putative tryptophan/tyrosine transport system substrate-binding protein
MTAEAETMQRRTFVAGMAALVGAPLEGEAQPTATAHRIGVLWASPRDVDFDPFIQGLRELGYVEGRNLVVEFRTGTPPEFPSLAADLVRLNVQILVTQGTQATRAAMKATDTTPIVMVGAADPVATGVVASLHHPGGNVTGSTDMRPALTAKRVEFVKEIVPAATRLGALFEPTEPAVTQEWADTETAAGAVGLTPVRIEVRAAGDIAPALARLKGDDGRAILVVFARIFTTVHRRLIIELATSNKIPAVGSAAFARMGGLVGIGAKYTDLLRRSAILVERIFKGAKPANLPVEQPTTFETIVNLKTAKALGVTIPPSLLLRADQLIE